jgi:hypothetical protein
MLGGQLLDNPIEYSSYDDLIFLVIRSILHNPEAYPNPFQFDPTRHLSSSGAKPQPDPRDVAFGWGRRFVVLLESVAETCAQCAIIVLGAAPGSPLPTIMFLLQSALVLPRLSYPTHGPRRELLYMFLDQNTRKICGDTQPGVSGEVPAHSSVIIH